MHIKKHILYQRAFSMVEVIVAAVLFAVASAGIFATISYTNRKVETDTRTLAATCAKKILDDLNKDVSWTTWDTGLLSVGNHNVPAMVDFPTCNASYVVTNDVATSARKVVVTVICP